MSITLTQIPSTSILSSNNPAVFVVSSSNATQIDMKYRADIYLNGLYLTTQKDFPNPNTGLLGTFNIADVAANLFNYDFFPSGTIGFVQCPNSSITLQAFFGEEYTTNAGVFSQSLSLISSSTLNFINSSLSYPDQVSVNMNDYFIDGTTQKKCLTKKNNNTFQAYTNLNQWLYFYNSASAAFAANVYTYDVNGNILGTYTIPNPSSGSTGVQAFGSGYPNLSALPTSSYSVVSGAYPMITGQVYYYLINLGGLITQTTLADLIDFDSAFLIDSDGGFLIQPGVVVSGSSNSILYQYNITPNCGKFAPGSLTLEWINTFGAVESFLFTKGNQSSVTKTQSQYKKVAGQLNSNGTYTFNSYAPQNLNYYTETQESWILNTDWLDYSTILYLKDLFSSPLIWLKTSAGNTYPVCVKDDAYKIIPKTIQKLYQLQLTVDLGFTDYRQRQ